ncbi:hypothetical protein RJ641_016188 [Dillenia turbinata]|uniref:Ycf20-like protein n=1 Tax=Dillenia turbinata TaxID=194707 RepID=A0AAN8UW78_9MAGN
MATKFALPCNHPSKLRFSSLRFFKSRIQVVGVVAFLDKTDGCRLFSPLPYSHIAQLPLLTNYKNVNWSIRSNVEGREFDPPPTNNSNGSTRLFRAIQDIRIKLNTRIQEIRKGLPIKLLFFLVGFYCATAFATVIGQTGDWDILSAALAVAIVEGIGALMYGASLPLRGKIRSLIIMFNYWKAGLSLGLFLDSFKYEIDDFFGSFNPFNVELDILFTF